MIGFACLAIFKVAMAWPRQPRNGSAERRIGQEIRAGQERGEIRRSGVGTGANQHRAVVHDDDHSSGKLIGLADLDISKNQSADYQKLADVEAVT